MSASESERVLRAVAAQRCTQPRQPRDPLARAIAKLLCLLCGVLLAAAALWLRFNINWVLIGQR